MKIIKSEEKPWLVFISSLYVRQWLNANGSCKQILYNWSLMEQESSYLDASIALFKDLYVPKSCKYPARWFYNVLILRPKKLFSRSTLLGCYIAERICTLMIYTCSISLFLCLQKSTIKLKDYRENYCLAVSSDQNLYAIWSKDYLKLADGRVGQPRTYIKVDGNYGDL